MDWILYLKAAILGIVEGLTEFLPISSTGHLIVAASLLDFTGENAKTFEVAIQTGAMIAVIWEYRRKLAGTVTGLGHDPAARRFAMNVLIAFAPAVALALVFGNFIKAHLFHPVPVAAAFVIGGLVILFVEKRHKRLYGERDLQGQRLAGRVVGQHRQLQVQAFAERARGDANGIESLHLVQHDQHLVLACLDVRTQRLHDAGQRLAQVAVFFQCVDQGGADAAVALGQMREMQLPQQVAMQRIGFRHALGGTAPSSSSKEPPLPDVVQGPSSGDQSSRSSQPRA